MEKRCGPCLPGSGKGREERDRNNRVLGKRSHPYHGTRPGALGTLSLQVWVVSLEETKRGVVTGEAKADRRTKSGTAWQGMEQIVVKEAQELQPG